MNLLFLNAGRRCELIDAFRRALNVREGGRIYATDIDPLAPALSRVDGWTKLPHSSHPQFVPRLSVFVSQHKIDVLIPSIDPDLRNLSARRDEIQAACPHMRLLLSPAKAIHLSSDKNLSRARFAELGADIPIGVDLDDPNLSFPIFMKPAHGSASEGIRVLHSAEELKLYRHACEAPMFERVVKGPETTVDVLCDLQGKALFAVPRKRLKVRGGEVSRGVVACDSQLEALAMRMAEGFGCAGPVTVQFRSPEKGRYVAMEINARVGGGLPLSIAAGADWPGWILDLCAGKEPDLNVAVDDGMVMSRYDQSVFTSGKKDEPDHTPIAGMKAVIFDLDDTLYPERDFVYAGYRTAAEMIYQDHGVEVEPILRRLFEQGIRQNIFGRALEQVGIEGKETYLKRLVTCYRENGHQLRPHTDIAILEELKAKGLKLGLVSDGFLRVQRSKVRALGIKKLFDAIIYSDEIDGRRSWKPSQEPYLACLSKLQVDPGEAVYVADNPSKDFVAPNQLGMASVRIRRPGGEHSCSTAPSSLHKAQHEIVSLTGLRGLLS